MENKQRSDEQSVESTEAPIEVPKRKKRARLWYPIVKHILVRPICKFWYRGRIKNQQNIPINGGAILACNHIAVGETFLLPALMRRRLTYPAKAELFTGKGGLGNKILAGFLHAMEQIPLDRSGGKASIEGLRPIIEFLNKGRLVGIFPEGTRSPDGRLYKGKTGVARMALAAGVPVIPVAASNTKWVKGRLGIPVLDHPTVVIGRPRDYSQYRDRINDHAMIRWITDDIMAAIQELSGQEYVDLYGRSVKKGNYTPEEVESRVKPRPGKAEPPARETGE